jgi:hypothetical protein
MRLLEILNPIARGVRAAAREGREEAGEVLLFPSFYLLLHQFGGKDLVQDSILISCEVT